MQSLVSIARRAMAAICMVALVGCPPPKNSRVRNRLQQTRHERLVLGFTNEPQAVVFLDLRDRVPPALRMIRLDTPEASDAVPIDATIAESVEDTSATRETVVRLIRASSTGARLEAFGMHWAKLCEAPIPTALGSVNRRAEHIQARADDATTIELATLGNAVLPDFDVWTTSDSGDLFAVELIYAGQPRVRDLHVFTRDNVDVRLALLRAEQAMARNANDEAADRLAFASSHVAAGDSNASAIAYARARLAARQHDVDTSVTMLRDAVAHDRRYRGQAIYEHDFDGVRNEPRFIEFLAVTPDR